MLLIVMRRAQRNKLKKNRPVKLRMSAPWKLLIEVCSALRWRYLLFVAAILLFGFLSLLPAELFKFFTGNVIKLSQISAQAFITRFAVFGTVVAVALFASQLGHTICQEWLRLKFEADLRRRVLRRLHEIPLALLDGSQRGDWLTRMTSDLSQTEMFLTDSIPNQIREAAIVLGAGTLFVWHSGWIALVPLVTALALALMNLKMQQKLAPVLSELRGLHGGVIHLLIENLEGIRTIRSHSAEPYIQRHFESRLAEITSKSMSVVRTLGILIGGSDFVGKLMVTLCLTLATWGLSHGALTVNEVLFYPFFIGLFYDAAQSLAGNAYDWNRYFTQGGKLAELLYNDTAEGPMIDSIGSARLQQAATLRVSDLSLAHQGRSITPRFTFEATRAEIWAVMGPSGSGKSTFLELLCGLRSAGEGQAHLFGEDGLLLWDSSTQALPRFPIGAAALVEQHPYIFEGSLRDNLTLGNPLRLSDMALWAALEKTSLYSLAASRGGLNLRLDDRGQNLSVGERYRIALCRALLLKRPFLLLDEPFAALDEKTIELVIETLEKERRDNAGIIVVTHYLPLGFRVDGLYHFDHFRPEKKARRGSLGVASLSISGGLGNAGTVEASTVAAATGVGHCRLPDLTMTHLGEER